jgi:regulator of sigma D
MQLLVPTTIDGIVSAIRNGNDNTLLSALELLVCISDERTQRIANLAAPVLQNFCNKFLQYSNAETIVSAIRSGNDNTFLSALELLVCISDERTQRIANLAAPVLQNFCNKFLQYSNAETRRHG